MGRDYFLAGVIHGDWAPIPAVPGPTEQGLTGLTPEVTRPSPLEPRDRDPSTTAAPGRRRRRRRRHRRPIPPLPHRALLPGTIVTFFHQIGPEDASRDLPSPAFLPGGDSALGGSVQLMATYRMDLDQAGHLNRHKKARTFYSYDL
uniref:Uncharacterized protein n=1 Tax=Oryza meridionalis TaxID=40149 RepID=A0A0E0FCR8_9ORYZ